jgi:hypothetical protein
MTGSRARSILALVIVGWYYGVYPDTVVKASSTPFCDGYCNSWVHCYEECFNESTQSYSTCGEWDPNNCAAGDPPCNAPYWIYYPTTIGTWQDDHYPYYCNFNATVHVRRNDACGVYGEEHYCTWVMPLHTINNPPFSGYCCYYYGCGGTGSSCDI